MTASATAKIHCMALYHIARYSSSLLQQDIQYYKTTTFTELNYKCVQVETPHSKLFFFANDASFSQRFVDIMSMDHCLGEQPIVSVKQVTWYMADRYICYCSKGIIFPTCTKSGSISQNLVFSATFIPKHCMNLNRYGCIGWVSRQGSDQLLYH